MLQCNSFIRYLIESLIFFKFIKLIIGIQGFATFQKQKHAIIKFFAADTFVAMSFYHFIKDGISIKTLRNSKGQEVLNQYIKRPNKRNPIFYQLFCNCILQTCPLHDL